ncbi:MAG: class I SAM-dependent methyltransferase [Bacteroidota bacterium]
MPSNEQLWDDLSRHGVLCSQPKLHLSVDDARQYINRNGFYPDDLTGKDVLCLASGGGQQSIGFALLGANVTVVDFSAKQLEKDREVAEAYQKDVRIVKADMQDLSFADNQAFDIVYQPYSINYVPSVEKVFDEVARVLRPGGTYDLMFHNPFVHGSWTDGCWGSEWQKEDLWRGKGYPIWQPYRDGEPIRTDDPHWNFANQTEGEIQLDSPQEYRHTLSTMVNGLIKRGFEICELKEETGNQFDAEPGSWDHYQSVTPPWLYLFGRKRLM